MPFQRINVNANHTLFFRHPGVQNNKPLAIATGANAIQWSYGLNTAQQPTFGGMVIQVLSTTAEAMTITGQTKNNTQLRDIYEWFKEYGIIAGLNHRDERGVLFQYPERNWGFYLQPTQMPGFKYGVDKIAVEWTITAEIVADSAGDLNKATMSPFQGENKLFDPSLFSVGFQDRSPWSDPNGDPRALDAAANYADNFQSLLGAYASGDFAHWAFDELARPKDNKLNTDTKDFWTQLLGSDFVSGAQANQSLGSSVNASTTGSSVLLNTSQNQFSSGVATATGLDFAVVAAWVHAEEPKDRSAADQGYNWLNIGPGQTFNNTQDAINATVHLLKTSSNYTGIINSAGESASKQIQAIADSPWDANHYRGSTSDNGSFLRAVYKSIIESGLTISGGDRQKVTAYAKAGIQDAPHPYGHGNRPPVHYKNLAGHWPNEMDCSLFVSLCYLWAGAADPAGLQYNGSDSFSMEQHQKALGTQVSLNNVKAGDLVIYNDHVAVFIDDGNTVASMGSANGPHKYSLATESSAHSDSPRFYAPLGT